MSLAWNNKDDFKKKMGSGFLVHYLGMSVRECLLLENDYKNYLNLRFIIQSGHMRMHKKKLFCMYYIVKMKFDRKNTYQGRRRAL